MRFVTWMFAGFLVGCASTSYEPVREQSFAQLAANGCVNGGQQVMVTAQVSKAYQDTVVLWDGTDPQQTIAATLGGRGPVARLRGWFGENKYELSEQQLNELAAQRTPVTVTLECSGAGVAPVARNISYQSQDGTRVAIGY